MFQQRGGKTLEKRAEIGQEANSQDHFALWLRKLGQQRNNNYSGRSNTQVFFSHRQRLHRDFLKGNFVT